VHNISTKVRPASFLPPKRRRPFRLVLLVVVLLAVAVLSLLVPPVFRFALRHALVWEAGRHGVDLKLDRLDGSLFEPLVFSEVECSWTSPMGTAAKASVSRADASFSWKNLAFKHGAGWFRELIVDGLNAEITFYSPPPGPESGGAESLATAATNERPWLENLVPARIEVRRANLAFSHGGNSVRFRNISFSADNLAPGSLSIESVAVNEPWLKRTFPNVRGTTALNGPRITVSNLALDEGVTVQSFSTDLAQIKAGNGKMDFDLAAFGGSIRGEARNRGRSHRHVSFDASGTFSQIFVPQLGKFLQTSEKTGGVVKEGTFTFQGSPRDVEHATLRLRLEAADFQWGERKWNSLAGGATMLNGRIQIPELHLKQAHNELSLNGDMAIPSGDSQWWQSEFAFNIAAKIDNLTELSALLGPRFAYMAGRMTIDGSVRGQNQSFAGQLIGSGSQLWYGSAPLDEMQAAIKLNGKELQITHVEFLHKDDYLRGYGIIGILGEQRYWGQLRASVADLSVYWALIEPFVSWCEGGLAVDWSGSGTGAQHSGQFHAQLKNFRTIPAPHQINADVEATYAPQNISFSAFTVSDAESSFTAKVSAAPKTLSVESIKLEHKKAVCLEGSAVLPIDVWTAWEKGSWLSGLDFAAACKASLTARKLPLREATLLTGRQFPLRGVVDGKLAGGGSLSALKLSGLLEFAKAEIPLGGNLPALSEMTASLALNTQDIVVEKCAAHFNSGDLALTGQIRLKDVRNPALKLRAQGKNVQLALAADLKATVDGDVAIEGPYSAAQVAGSVRLVAAEFTRKLDLVSLLTPGGEWPAPFATKQPPLRDWQFNVECTSGEPVKLTGSSATVAPDLRIGGTGAMPKITGILRFENVPAPSPFATFKIDSGSLFFPAQNPGDPVMSIRGSGSVGRYAFDADVLGPRTRKQVMLSSDPPLADQSLLDLIAKGSTPAHPENPSPASAPTIHISLQPELLLPR
jgi:translocation-and-assembly-module (TAM) inner membrane subunit TamB-like protein